MKELRVCLTVDVEFDGDDYLILKHVKWSVKSAKDGIKLDNLRICSQEIKQNETGV